MTTVSFMNVGVINLVAAAKSQKHQNKERL